MDSIIFDVDGTLWDSADSVAAHGIWQSKSSLPSTLHLTGKFSEVFSGKQ